MVTLTRAHMGWVRLIRWRDYPNVPFATSEELLGAGMVGLVSAARRYDPSRGATFSTYAWRRIHGAMADELRRECHWRARDGLSTARPPPLLTGGWSERKTDAVHGSEDNVSAWELSDTLRDAMQCLTPRERYVIRRHYLQNRTLAEIGARLGVTNSRACQIATSACAKLRRVLDRESLDA